MFTVPVYAPAGNCGTPAVLIFQVSVVVVLPVRLRRVIRTWPICTPVAATGVTKAGTPAPPLTTEFSTPPTLPDPAAVAVTALAGILSLAPSVRAAAPFGTQAHTLTRVRPGRRAHAVRIVLIVLPALAARLARSAKFTVAPPVSDTVSDSVNLAFRTTAPAFELTWAIAPGQIAADNVIVTISKRLLKFLMDVRRNAKSGSDFDFSSLWFATLFLSHSTATTH